MSIVVSEDIWNFDLEDVMQSLPSWRRDEVARYRRESDRRQRVLAYRLLVDMLARECNIHAPLQWERGPHGKPFLPQYPRVHFNVSHCDLAVACAVSDRPVGVDVEIVAPLDLEVAHRVLAPDELTAVLAHPTPSLAFTRLWTLKESALKMQGTGLVDDLRCVKPLYAQSQVGTGDEGTYVWALCTATPQDNAAHRVM